MKKAFFYKEWIKTRWFLLAILIGGVLVEIYLFLKLGRSFRYAGHEHLWDVIVNRNQFMFHTLKYFPILAGLLIGVVQMIPEIVEKRLKLSLHLPLYESKTITLMVGYILIILISIFIISFITLILGAAIYFPLEIIKSIAITVLPWYLCGITAYLLVVFCCLEPLWRRRIINILISVCFLGTYFLSSFPGAYSKNILTMMIIPAISFLLIYLSVFRFKTGVQTN